MSLVKENNTVVDGDIDSEAIDTMRIRGGSRYAYRNADLSSRGVGHLTFLKCGEGCTCAIPPKKSPNDWRYYLIGIVDLEAGLIRKYEGEAK